MGLTSPPQLDTRGIDVRLMSEESLLEAREEIRRTKEGFYQEDNGVKGIPFEMGCYLTPVSLLQVYFVMSSRNSQGLYLCWTMLWKLMPVSNMVKVVLEVEGGSD